MWRERDAEAGTVSKASTSGTSNWTRQQESVRDNNTTRHDYCVPRDTRHHRRAGQGEAHTHTPLFGGMGLGAQGTQTQGIASME